MSNIIIEDYENVLKRISINKFINKTFLITGATGFIGSQIVGFLMYLNKKTDCNCKVIALCRNREKSRVKFLEYVDSELFMLEIRSISEEMVFTESIDFIIHAASISNTKYFADYPVDLLTSNIIGTWRLLELTRNQGAKLMFLSSGAAYGDYTNDIYMFEEDMVFLNNYLDPRKSYATGKRGGEAFCRAYTNQYNTNTVMVRISHTYGPLIDLNDGKVFSDFIRNILDGEDLLIKGSGLDFRPYCYISDTISAIFMVLFCGANGEVYNIANPYETLTVSELAEQLAYQVFPEKNLKIKYLNKYVNVKDNRKVYVSIEKISKLGWKPIVSVHEGFKRTVAYFGGL